MAMHPTRLPNSALLPCGKTAYRLHAFGTCGERPMRAISIPTREGSPEQ